MKIVSKKNFIKRILLLYIISTLIYIPIHHCGLGAILHGYYHLWYLNSLLIALTIIYLSEVYFPGLIYSLKVIVFLILIGLFLDEYHKLLDNTVLNKIVKLSDTLFGGGRSAFFFALPMLLLGGYIAKNNQKIFKRKNSLYIFLLLLTSAISLIEFIFLLSHIEETLSADITAFNWMPAIFIFILSFSIKINPNKYTLRIFKFIRKSTDIMYIIHIWLIILIDKYTNITYISRFLLILIASAILSSLICYVFTKFKEKLIIKLQSSLTP